MSSLDIRCELSARELSAQLSARELSARTVESATATASSPTGASIPLEDLKRELRSCCGQKGSLEQRVCKLEDSMQNIERMLRCLMESVTVGAQNADGGKEQRTPKKQSVSSQRPHGSQPTSPAVSSGSPSERPRSHCGVLGGKRLRVTTSEAPGKLPLRSKVQAVDKLFQAVTESAESEGTPTKPKPAGPSVGRRGRFRWPMDLHAARAELQEELGTVP